MSCMGGLMWCCPALGSLAAWQRQRAHAFLCSHLQEQLSGAGCSLMLMIGCADAGAQRTGHGPGGRA